ncbi:MAG: helix-turn-helix domain-containing protein [Solirubrobacterales bacterium]
MTLSEQHGTSAAEGAQAPPEGYGAHLRRCREQRGLSARALARSVGVSPSLISQIENGKANPSVGTLYAIVSALGVSFDQLFSDAASQHDGDDGAVPDRSRVSDHVVLRKEDRPFVDLDGGVRWERLTPTPDANVDFLFATYGVGGESCPPDALMRHSGREYGLMLSGRLGATIGFDTYELGPGDSIVADSSKAHRFWTIGDEPAVVVWTVIGRGADPRAALRP